ncbi:Endonuclease/exonuclease/phosphatase [Hysterangium stoloniferum]|nr:Endonuclease/exonuclease/phosphatase [Hysterangium stoloniferum]
MAQMHIIQPKAQILDRESYPYPASDMAQVDFKPLAFYRARFWKPKRWQPSHAPTQAPLTQGLNPTLRIATYNIWFENRNNAVRHREILRILGSPAVDADIICLQEVTPGFLASLANDLSIQRDWVCSDLTGAGHGEWHGCLVLFNRRTVVARRITVVGMPGGEVAPSERRMTVAEVDGVTNTRTAGMRGMRVATAHLQSPGMHRAEAARARQVREAYTILTSTGMKTPSNNIEPETTMSNSNTPSGVFCGDTNLCLDGENEIPTKVGFRDAWIQARNNPYEGHTINVNYPTKYAPQRIDRLFTVGDVFAIKAEIFGGDTISSQFPDSTIKEYPSDHLGVVAEFRIQNGVTIP